MQPRIVTNLSKWTGTLVAALSILFLAACGSDEDGGDAATDGEQVRVGFSKVGPNSFLEAAIEEAERFEEFKGFEAQWDG